MTDQPFAGISPLVQQWLSDTGNDIHIGRNDTFSLGYQAACATLSTMIWDVYKECDPPCGPSRRNQITGQRWCQPTAAGWEIPGDDDDDTPIVIVQQAPPVDPKLIERIYYMSLTQGAAGEFARGMAWMATEIARVMDFPLAIRQPAAPDKPFADLKAIGEIEEWEFAPADRRLLP